jgi:1,4-alpha-glucan branching enzyme
MGNEIAQGLEWNYKDEVNWNLLDFPQHRGIQATVKELNRLYATEKALHENNFNPDGFQWMSVDDAERSVLVYLRKGKNKKDQILIACNFTPIVHEDFNVKVPPSKRWKEIFNSDDAKYGGSSVINTQPVKAHSINENENVINFRLPPLGVVMLKIMMK